MSEIDIIASSKDCIFASKTAWEYFKEGLEGSGFWTYLSEYEEFQEHWYGAAVFKLQHVKALMVYGWRDPE